jgi:hypothetical protein
VAHALHGHIPLLGNASNGFVMLAHQAVDLLGAEVLHGAELLVLLTSEVTRFLKKKPSDICIFSIFIFDHPRMAT